MVLREGAGELAQGGVAGGESGFGDVGQAGAKQGGGMIEAETPEMDGGAVAELRGEETAEVGGAGVGGGGELGQADGLGEMGAHEVEGGSDRGMQHARGGPVVRNGIGEGTGKQEGEQFDEFTRAPECAEGGGNRASAEGEQERLHGRSQWRGTVGGSPAGGREQR